MEGRGAGGREKGSGRRKGKGKVLGEDEGEENERKRENDEKCCRERDRVKGGMGIDEGMMGTI